VLEVLAVLASPAVLFGILRPMAMAPVQLPDPSMHSTFIFDPGGLFSRFGSALSPEIMGDSARVGFLLPARLSYLLFGAVPGFFVYRYFLALIAVIPVYLLLRKLYGPWAGWVGIFVVISSPVVLATWGSDYSSSAAISYLTGGLGALALSLEGGRWTKSWLLGAGALFTLAVWTDGICALLVLAAFVAYFGIRLLRDRRLLAMDALAVCGVAVVVTVVLAAGSKLLLGWWNIIQVSIKATRQLDTPQMIQAYHSTSWAWAPYDLYLLVPPAVAVCYFIMFAGRTRMRSSVALVGGAGSLQLLLFAYLQFFGHLWVLELPLFSCLLWSSTNLMLALVVSESVAIWTRRIGSGSYRTDNGVLASPPRRVRVAAISIPALIVLAVPLAYEASPRAPALTWFPWGYIIALTAIAAAAVARQSAGWTNHARHASIRRRSDWIGSIAASATVIIVGATLILTVAPGANHTPPRNTKPKVLAYYSLALGGADARYLEEYRVDSEIPAFVGKPAYRGERLVMWSQYSEYPSMSGPVGLYDCATNCVRGSFPSLDTADEVQINGRRPGQMLLMKLNNSDGFNQAVKSLTPYGPVVVRRAVLGNSNYRLNIWLINLTRFDYPSN
jgi:hypothetical protein